jgi:transcriptional/translational regulatory protein YebC/TACO1
MVINVLSDNANRATADVKSTVNKRGGKIAEQGSVLFMYDKKGKIEIPNIVLQEETLLDVAIEAGIEDFTLELLDSVDGSTTTPAGSVVLVEPTDSSAMLEAIKTMGYEDAKMSLTWITKAPVECNDDDFDKNMEIIDALEELDDVDSVEHNMSN